MTGTIHINASVPYDAVVGNGILPEIGTELRKRFRFGKVAVFADDTVDRLYSTILSASLDKAGIGHSEFIFANGEKNKTLGTVAEFISHLAAQGFDRNDAVLTFGGGVAGDMGGLAAALYMRGISSIQIPTTLLAMVDSSVGGKTAVDIPEGKNLVGVFHQPSLVWCDTALLRTLPKNIFRDGFAEVIKYGILFDRNFFDGLEYGSDISDTVSASIRFKRDVVETDEFDRGGRALLNLGHTIGHAIELLSGFTLSHGESVAIGISRIARISAAYGFADISAQVDRKLKEFGFTIDSPFSAEDIFHAALSDKKRNGQTIRLVLPQEIGRCGLYDIPLEQFRDLLIQTEKWT